MDKIAELQALGLYAYQGGFAGEFGWIVQNPKYDTATFFTNRAFSEKTADQIEVYTHQGRHIDHITRITGYYSKVSGWNKGKISELADRVRSTI